MPNTVVHKQNLREDQHDLAFGQHSTLLRSDEASSDQRKLHWKGPSLLVASLVIGVGAATAHHFLYSHYDGKPALPTDQERLHFGGLALARIVSMLLTLAAGIAFRQWIWRLLRRKSLPIGSIDTLSVLDSSMFELVTGWKTWPLATFAMLLAVFLNCIQVPSLISPGSLSTEIVSQSDIRTMDVPATRICQFGFDASNPSNRLDGNALWNTANVNNTGCYAYYDSTSDRINSGLNKVLWGTSYAGQIPQLKSPCGVNGNCSYTLNYLAPTLQCSSIPPPEISPRFGSMGGYLPQNYTSGDDYIGMFFMAFGGTIVKRTFNDTNSSVYRNFNMTLLTGVSPVTYQSWDCGFFNTSMAFNFTYTGQSSSQVVLEKPPTYLNEIDFGASIFDYDTYLGPNSVETYWTQMTGLFAGIVQGQIGQNSHDIYDGSGFSSNTDTFSQRTANLSAARDTSLGRYIYTGPDRVTAGYDPLAPGDAGTALEEISRNISVAMTQMYVICVTPVIIQVSK